MVVHVVLFVSAYVTYSLVDRLTVLLGSKTLGTKKHNSQSVKIYKRTLLRPHFQRNIYREMKEELTSQKNILRVKKKKKKKKTSDNEG